MESRMQGNLHVRFGAGMKKPAPATARRFIPTLPKIPLRSHSFFWNERPKWGRVSVPERRRLDSSYIGAFEGFNFRSRP